jgi:hypothetical protein
MGVQLDNRPGSEYEEDWKPGTGSDVDDLNDQFDAPAATDENLPPNHPSRSLSGEELKSAEKSAESPDTGKVDSKEDSHLPSSNKGKEKLASTGHLPGEAENKSVVRKVVWQKKTGIIAMILALITGGGIGFIGISQGPLQLIHAGRLLQGFHFSPYEDLFENRLSKAYRYTKYPDKPQNRRLTVLGNRSADKIETKLRNAGIDFELDAGNRVRRVNIDVDQARAAGVDVDQLARDFDADIRNGRLEIDIENKVTTARSERRLFSSMRKGVGAQGLRASIQGRLLTKRLGISLHPIRKLDQRALRTINEARIAWKTRKIAEIGGSNELRFTGDSRQESDSDRAPPENSTDGKTVADDVERIKSDTSDLSGQKRVSGIKTNLRVTGAASAVVGLSCAVVAIADAAEELEYLNVILPSAAVGGYIIGLGSQIESNQDIDSLQLGFEADQMYQEEFEDGEGTVVPTSSFFGDESIQSEQGNTGGTPLYDAAKVGGSQNVLSRIKNYDPEMSDALTSTCGVVNSVGGQIVQFGVDILLGPVSAIVGAGAGLVAAPFIDDLVRLIAGEAINADLAGAALGGVANQGSFFMSNMMFMSMGATQLSEPERTALADFEKEIKFDRNRNLPVTERYFSLSNPHSLITTIALFHNIDMSAVTSLPKTLISNATQPGKLFGFIPKTYANATNYDYGVPKYAYSTNEIELINSDESYKNMYINTRRLDALKPIPELHEEYSEKCFGLKFDTQERFTMLDPPNMIKSEYDENCGLSTEGREIALRYRLYITDLMVQVTSNCYDGDALACTEIGFGGVSTATPVSGNADPGQDTSGLSCPPGTEDGGVHQDYGPGGVPTVQIRICGIPNAIAKESGVNASIASQALAMIEAMRAEGLNPRGSSFRSYESQVAIRERNCPDPINSRSSDCSPPTATAGNSMHEVGLAIDFNDMCYPNSTCPAGRNDRYDWLVENAANHGFQKLSSEAWHWSVNGR